MISDRTRAALTAAKARGKSLGGFRGRAGSCTDLTRARAERTLKANQRALDLAPTIEALRSAGAYSLRSIAAGLNSRSITTARGAEWSAAQVRTLTYVGQKCLKVSQIFPARFMASCRRCFAESLGPDDLDDRGWRFSFGGLRSADRGPEFWRRSTMRANISGNGGCFHSSEHACQYRAISSIRMASQKKRSAVALTS